MTFQIPVTCHTLKNLQSRTKVVGTLELGHISPIPLINVGKYRVSSNKKRKNHPIINIVSGGRRELARCPNLFVRDCLKKEFEECHTTCCNRVPERQGVYRLARTRNAHCKQRKQKNGSKSSKENPRGYLLTSLVS